MEAQQAEPLTIEELAVDTTLVADHGQPTTCPDFVQDDASTNAGQSFF
jgi:hypothetical protein